MWYDTLDTLDPADHHDPDIPALTTMTYDGSVSSQEKEWQPLIYTSSDSPMNLSSASSENDFNIIPRGTVLNGHILRRNVGVNQYTSEESPSTSGPPPSSISESGPYSNSTENYRPSSFLESSLSDFSLSSDRDGEYDSTTH